VSKTSPTYIIRLKPRPGTDGIKTLRAALKLLGRRFGLRAIKIETEDEIRASEHASPVHSRPV
jgi:hypothetical protein